MVLEAPNTLLLHGIAPFKWPKWGSLWHGHHAPENQPARGTWGELAQCFPAPWQQGFLTHRCIGEWCRGAAQLSDVPSVGIVPETAPSHPNIYTDGSLTKQRRSYICTAGAGAWVPQTTMHQHSLQDTDLN